MSQECMYLLTNKLNTSKYINEGRVNDLDPKGMISNLGQWNCMCANTYLKRLRKTSPGKPKFSQLCMC